MKPWLTPSFIAITTVLVWATTALASLTFWPVYEDPQLVLLVSVALVLGAAIAIVGALRRWSSGIVTLVTVGVFLVVGVPLAVPSQAIAGIFPSLEGEIELISSVALGWKRLLTITLPVGSYQALLVPLLVLVLVTSVTALSVGLRAKWGELGVIAPVLFFVAGIIFGPATPTWPIAMALSMLGASLAWLVWRRWRRRRDAVLQVSRAATAAAGAGAVAGTQSTDRPREGFTAVRPILFGALILGVAGVSSIAATTALPPEGNRDVLRTAIEQPFDPRDYPSPLSGFRRYLHEDRVDQPMLRVTDLPEGARIRIATLDSYDGIVYAVGSSELDSASGTFVRVPASVDQSRFAGEPVRIEVEVDGYTGVWVPTVGQLESVKFEGDNSVTLADSFFYNDTSGTAADLEPLASGDRYSLRAVLAPIRSTSQLSEVTPGAAVVPRIDVLPEGIAPKLDEYLQGATSPGEQLLAIVSGLRDEGYISHGLSPDEPSSRSGHAADRITELLTAPRMIGDAEQYAVAAALMVRQLGFPTRAVVGFAPTADETASGSAVTLDGSDITAWIEVNTAQYGWVALDPVPEVRPIPEEQPQDPTTVSRPESIVPPPPDRPEPREDTTGSDSSQQHPNGLDPTLAAFLAVARIVGWVVLVLGVIAAPFLLVIAAKARRRRLRRQSPTTLGKIRGGWDEFADAVVDHGFEAPPAATRTELAGVVGTLPARVLAAVVDRTVFAPDDPDPSDADRVWSAVADLREALDVGKSRWSRILTLVSVRSLGGDSVRRLFAR